MSGQTAQATAGVYVGIARGAKSDIKMAVEFDGEKILNVWNVENGDTAVFSQIAADTVAQEIVENQSLSVDVVSGATLTSRAAMLAAANALEQAGVSTADWMVSQEVEKTTRPTEEYDVVVVGARRLRPHRGPLRQDRLPAGPDRQRPAGAGGGAQRLPRRRHGLLRRLYRHTLRQPSEPGHRR